MSDEILGKSARELMSEVASRRISVHDVVAAFLARVEALNPFLNAVCTINPDALIEAAAADRRLAEGGRVRRLEGVPFVVKDVIHTKGIRTTFGSTICEHFIPEEDAVSVERLKAAGAILLGKTNTPEFAHDINTANRVFGTTRNPTNLNTSAGGSSGGTAAALGADMAPIGLGTDLGGSIRIPSAFCGVVGLRPVPGRVPFHPSDFAWDTLVEHVQGPMGRTVEDVGLALEALAGPDDRDPTSLPGQGPDYHAAARGDRPLAGRRIAYSPDLNGLVPVAAELEHLTRQAASRFEDLGCIVEENCFDVSGLGEIRAGTRAFGMIARYADYLPAFKDVMTPPLLRQIAQALDIDVRMIANAERIRTMYWHRVRHFLQTYDYILTPTVGITAFRLDQRPPSALNGKPIRFRDVFLFTYAFSVTGLPAASVPCGFIDGLPVGLQIVGRRLCEEAVLEAAAAYAVACPQHFKRMPVDLDSVRWTTSEPLTDFV